MPSFFDDDDNDDISRRNVPVAGPSRPPPRLARQERPAGDTGSSTRATSALNAHASSSRHPYGSSSPASSNAFLARLQSVDVTADTSFGQTTVDGGEYGMDDADKQEPDWLGEMEQENDVIRLSRAWVKERGTTDIMKWEGELVEDCLEKLSQQAKMLDLLRSDPKTSEEEHFKLMLVQTEMERVKFLIRAYVRCRMAKIEKYSHHITITPAKQMLLSQLELDHAIKYTKLLHTHYAGSVLNSLPEWLGKMDDVANDGLSMVLEPDKNVPVLIYCLKDCGDIVLKDGERASLEQGSMHLVRYSLVERWVELGWVEVL